MIYRATKAAHRGKKEKPTNEPYAWEREENAVNPNVFRTVSIPQLKAGDTIKFYGDTLRLDEDAHPAPYPESWKGGQAPHIAQATVIEAWKGGMRVGSTFQLQGNDLARVFVLAK